MNNEIISETSVDEFGDDPIGQSYVTNLLDLYLKTSNSAPIELLSGKSEAMTSGDSHIYIGNVLVQFGRHQANDSNPFHIDFQIPFKSNEVIVLLTGADNDPNHSIQLDGAALPNSTGFDVIINQQTLTGYVFWVALGAARF
tara:strand:- start:761 stop:1186 length:426 start_codon:yes stop_codon:yes gene_type:complete